MTALRKDQDDFVCKKNCFVCIRLFYNVIDDSKFNKIRNDLNRLDKKSIPGFFTGGGTNSSHSRSAILSKMEEVFVNRDIIVHSKRLLNELWTFIWKDGKFNGGRMSKVKWENGTFNGGTFINSNWKTGLFNGGTFTNSLWNTGKFTNGTLE